MRIVQPATAEEQQKYRELYARYDRQKYRAHKDIHTKDLRCMYCGGEYYAGGYCKACYCQINRGKPIDGTKPKGEINKVITGDWRKELYNTVTGESEMPEDFDAWLERCFAFRKVSGMNLISVFEKEVLLRYYRDGKTLADIGREIGKTREYARQVRERTINKLTTAHKSLAYAQEIAEDTNNVFYLGLSVRATNAMFNAGIKTVQELNEKLLNGELRNMRGVGATTIYELQKAVTDWKIAHEKQ